MRSAVGTRGGVVREMFTYARLTGWALSAAITRPVSRDEPTRCDGSAFGCCDAASTRASTRTIKIVIGTEARPGIIRILDASWTKLARSSAPHALSDHLRT